MPRFQFAIRDLCLSANLIALGVGGLCVAYGGMFLPHKDLIWTTMVFVGSGTLLAVGIAAPFQKKAVGALVGAIVAGLLLAASIWKPAQ